MASSITVVRFSDRQPQRWANGLGETTELYRDPADGEFRARLSVATIDSDAPFSALSGVDRLLLALGPDSLTLVVDGDRCVLGRHDVLAFPGEAVVAPEGVLRAGRDLNLMLRRGSATGSLTADAVSGCRTVHPLQGGVAIVVALAGQVQAGGAPLGALDTAVSAGPIEVGGQGTIAVVLATTG